jgi:prepilin-type N-terminal cleavage/methylation domain-containing protein
MAGMGNSKGFTLVELIVVMAIFVVFIMFTATTFDNLISSSSKQGRIAASQIEGIMGLEMLRTDLGHAGYALPWSYQTTPSYTSEVSGEPAAGLGVTGFSNLQDRVPTTTLPRSVITAATTSGRDYLVIKSAMLANGDSAVGRWAFVNYSGGNNSYLSQGKDPTAVVQGGNRVITIKSAFSSAGTYTKQLVAPTATNFSYAVPASLSLSGASFDGFRPANSTESYLAYSISSGDLRMPYNRADYYVDMAAVKPGSCAPGTGVLAKAVADQAGGYVTPTIPLLYCVGDLQVVYALLPEGYASGESMTGLTAEEIRAQISGVRVYILTHDGKRDPSFQYPYTDSNKVITVGGADDASAGRIWKASDMVSAFGADWRNYRWKVFSISVALRNTNPQ